MLPCVYNTNFILKKLKKTKKTYIHAVLHWHRSRLHVQSAALHTQFKHGNQDQCMPALFSGHWLSLFPWRAPAMTEGMYESTVIEQYTHTSTGDWKVHTHTILVHVLVIAHTCTIVLVIHNYSEHMLVSNLVLTSPCIYIFNSICHFGHHVRTLLREDYSGRSSA